MRVHEMLLLSMGIRCSNGMKMTSIHEGRSMEQGHTLCPKFLTKSEACGGGILARQHTCPISIPENHAMGRQPMPAPSVGAHGEAAHPGTGTPGSGVTRSIRRQYYAWIDGHVDGSNAMQQKA